MERYTDYVKIGEGSFGSVHRALDSQTGEQVAIKVFHNAGQEVSRSAVREARFLAESCHCNITALREAYQSGSGRVYLVLEFAHHVLSHQVKSHKKGLPTVAVRSIIFQLLQALHYLHSKGVMHRDCKPANILITNDGMVKLCDFGFARYVAGGAPPETADDPLTSYVITRWYRPPEVLAGQPYSCAVDIWAVGCILAEMLTGHPLFPGSSSIDQLYTAHIGLGGLTPSQQAFMNGHKDIKQAQADFNTRMAVHGSRDTVFDRLAPYMTRSMMQFFKACLMPDPSKRATAKDLLEMSFIREGAWDVPAPGQNIPETASNPETDAPEKNKPTETMQTANIETAAPQVDTPTPPGVVVKPSRSQRMGPTVKQRTAREVAMMMSDDEDGDHGVYEHLSKLPPGEPLSDSEMELSERTSSGVASPQRTSSPKLATKPSKANVSSHPSQQPAASVLQHADQGTTHAGAVKAHLHTSFATSQSRKRSHNGNTMSQNQIQRHAAASGRITEFNHRVQISMPDAHAEQGSSHHGSAFALAAKRNASAPGVSAFDEVDRSSSERDTGNRKERFSAGRSEDPVFGTKPPTGRKVQLREPACSQSATAGHLTDSKVARASNSSHVPSEDANLRASNSGVGRILRDKVSVPQSSSAASLAPRPSMRAAKQLPVRGNSQHSSKAGVSFAELPPSSTEHSASQQGFIPAKPTAVQMTAAAITQASAALVTMSTSFVDNGPKSAGHTLHSGHKPKCPPPPRAAHQSDAAAAGNQGQKPAAVNLAGKLGNSGFHVSGRLNKVVPSAAGGLVGVGQSQGGDGAGTGNRPHSGLAKSRVSQTGTLTSRLSISVTASIDGAPDNESPSAQAPGALSKSQRMLSPMGLRHTLSSKSAFGHSAATAQDHTAHEETL